MLHRADLLGAQPGDLDLDVFVPGGERVGEAGALAVGEAFLAGAQDVADPVQRVVTPAAVPAGVLLDPAPHVVDHGGGELDDMKRIEDGDGVDQVVVDGVAVPAMVSSVATATPERNACPRSVSQVEYAAPERPGTRSSSRARVRPC